MSLIGNTPPQGFVDCSPGVIADSSFSPAADTRAADTNGAGVCDPFQRELALLVDRAVYFEKIIARAQACKAEVLADAWNLVSSTAETGRPNAATDRGILTGHEHDWDATFAPSKG